MSCYLCGASRSHLRPGQVRDDAQARIRECEECGLVYLADISPPDEAFYAGGGMHGAAVSHVEEWQRESVADDQRRLKMLGNMVVNTHILDFGCGAGGFLQRARELAAGVVGVELELALQPHFAKCGLEVFADLSLVPNSRKFDLVTAFHVLEHLADPRSVLESLADRLASGGTLVVEVPNADDALLTLYESEAFSHFSYWSCHPFLFNGRTLPLLAKQAGLRVKCVKHVQRYPLSNHLYWLAKNKPGGHVEWAFLNDVGLVEAYQNVLASIGQTDTIVAYITQ